MKKVEDLKSGVPEYSLEKVMRTKPGNYLGSKNVRMVKFNKSITTEKPKEKIWYKELAGKQALLILFPGFKDGVLFSCPFNSPINGDHFTVVRRMDGMNDDLRFN